MPMEALDMRAAPDPKSMKPAETEKKAWNGEIVPEYLQKHYWWAYLTPNAVRIFDHMWVVNGILWGNYRSLKGAVAEELMRLQPRNLLQVACVYGDFTSSMAAVLPDHTSIDVIDIAPVQLNNLQGKINDLPNVELFQQNSQAMEFADDSYDVVVLFFLLHEMPESVRRKTMEEAARVTKPGGTLLFIDYHGPSWYNPMRLVMWAVLRLLEPFALDLWRNEIADYFAKETAPRQESKQTFFGGLYQKVLFRKD